VWTKKKIEKQSFLKKITLKQSYDFLPEFSSNVNPKRLLIVAFSIFSGGVKTAPKATTSVKNVGKVSYFFLSLPLIQC